MLPSTWARGHTAWQGPWSDRAKEWAEYPTVQQQLGYTFHDDGVFWMAIEDFCRIWSLVDGCKLMPTSWSMVVALDRWVKQVDSEAHLYVEEDGLLSSTHLWKITVAADTVAETKCTTSDRRERSADNDLVQCVLVLQQL